VREYLTDCRIGSCQIKSWLPLGGPNNDQAAMFWCPDHQPTVAMVEEDERRAQEEEEESDYSAYREAHDKRMAMEGNRRVVATDEQGGVVKQELLRCTAKTVYSDTRCCNMQWLSLDEILTSRPAQHFLCWSHERKRLSQSANYG
jgi:hypothetical protein